MKLIGVTGKARSGKDTVGNYLRNKHGMTTYALATPIKLALMDIFGLNESHFNHPQYETVIPKIGKSPRQLTQTLGTDWGRDLVNTNIWINRAERHMPPPTAPGFVITDIRFQNEADWIRRNNGIIIILKKENLSGVAEHISEHSFHQRPEDIVLCNNSTIASLHKQIDKLLVTKL